MPSLVRSPFDRPVAGIVEDDGVNIDLETMRSGNDQGVRWIALADSETLGVRTSARRGTSATDKMMSTSLWPRVCFESRARGGAVNG